MHKIKIVIVGLVCAATILLTGCNKAIFDTNYTFDKAIVVIGTERYEYDITEWTDYEGEQLQLKLTDGSTILVSSYNTILVSTSGGKSVVLK